ncbi:mutS family protein [Entamoeba histolytica HM-1:IMSS-B]|uniref:MutS family protein n=5 Tax=Entamoeba histolytica TaxID=5759 RepID=C4M4T8_ENTH1|nr:mutS family protein [Entamoeba histolytica HM-1:IMSS]EMH73628.1 mutS family protein [Entamoeba histolytica HM-1:IMSS-B]EMS16144.1 mutS family protein [Entamoeba histolytica HM-3:IMSS]ENY65595.1 mutS family protein, putative [Entamoeba histolytica HM-1:IMSS-A]GAT96395.1 muts family protein [Entamoeba histolytica]EAL46564.1 mutS family protein [Entamoeba histolytica HM-1:IMSS]|eukprot:XP_651951.1 mutS family protein [Entamoeba histolytica HM-1:IMSS]
MSIQSKLKFKDGMFNTTKREELHKQIETEIGNERYSFLINIKDKNQKSIGEQGYDPSTLFIPASCLMKMTPFEKQYWNIKKDNYDVVIFFAKGKFYELYENDADIGNKELGLKITNRVNMRMAGVPKASFNTYASKLLELGYKIGCVDEKETSEESKKRGATVIVNGKREPNIVRRELTRIYTVSTATEPELCSDTSDMFCMAIISNGCNVGVCYGDVSVGRIFLGYLEDTELHNSLHTLLHRVHPKEILLLNSISDDIAHICKNLKFAEITYVKEPEDINGVLPLFADRGRVPKVVEKYSTNDQVMTAFTVLYNYFTTLLVPKTTIINGTFGEYTTLSQDYLIVDAQSIVNLALFASKGKEVEGTLLHFVDNCFTAFGKRMLRERFLLKPLMDVNKILHRQEVVEFFLENNDLIDQIGTFLRVIPDLERLLSQCTSSTITESNFIRMISGFETCQKLMNELKTIVKDMPEVLQTIVLDKNNLGYPNLEEFISKLESIYDFTSAKEEHAITFFNGYNEEIDHAFERRNELENEFAKELVSIKKIFGEAKYVNIGGDDHLIALPIKQYESYLKKHAKLPSGYTEANKIKSEARLMSSKVSSIQTEYDLNEKQINDSHHTLFNQLINEVSSTLVLPRAITNIGLIDCFVSMARCSQSMETSCLPSFIKNGMIYSYRKDPEPTSITTPYFNAKQLKHPYLTVSTKTSAIPSNIILGGTDPQTIILTGPNMGGKSTLLRTVCLAVIMAQMGMRCTGEEITMSVVDHIFTRIGASDDILHGMSTFMVELDETAQMLHDATQNSLVVLDELGRGTSTHDGLAIAHAVVEYTVSKIKPLMIVSTHYHQLCEEFEERGDVKLSHMGCTIQNNQIIFLYTLLDGACPKSYGMKVAEMAGLPTKIVHRAENIATWFELYSWWKDNEDAQTFTKIVCTNKRIFEQ